MKALLRHIIGDSPKYVCIAAYATFGVMAVIGLIMSLTLITRSASEALLIFIFYLLLAAGSALVIIYAWKLYRFIIRSHTKQKLDRYFAEKGFCKEMADTLNAIVPAPSPRENALRFFLLVMSENYAEAEREIAHINEMQQESRDLAMILTAKIRLYLMTSRMEKAERLFENHSGTLDFAYESEPDLLPEYRVYGDDAFDYYMLAAVYSLLTNHPDKAAEYRNRAAFQLSKRSAGESQFYTGLLDLNALYALEKTKEAYDLSQQLFMLTEQTQPPFLQSQKDEMRRALEQAKIFASYTALRTESRLTERNLPPEEASVSAALQTEFTAL